MAVRRYPSKTGKPYCQKHFSRAKRSGGEARSQREIASIKAKAKRTPLIRRKRGLF